MQAFPSQKNMKSLKENWSRTGERKDKSKTENKEREDEKI